MQSRRQFIVKGAKLVAVGAAAASAGPSVFVRGAGAADKQLKVLQWARFVPAYDKWFDPWAKEWGAKRGVEVTVDHVGFADVVPRATAEVAAQFGHNVRLQPDVHLVGGPHDGQRGGAGGADPPRRLLLEVADGGVPDHRRAARHPL
jgi:hypothetical protein